MFYSDILSILIGGFLWVIIICAAIFVLLLLVYLIYSFFSKIKNKRCGKSFRKQCRKKKKTTFEEQLLSQSEPLKYDWLLTGESNRKSKKTTGLKKISESDYEKHKNDTYYKLKENVLSKGEKNLIKYLEKIIDPSKYLLIPQVHYDRYLEVNEERDEVYRAISASMINTKTTDFGIETIDHKPVCYIEFNDKSHKSEDRKKRDKFLFVACKKAGLPHIVITSQEINSQIAEKEDSREICKYLYKKFYFHGNPLNFPSPICPKCGKEFKLLVGDYGAFLSHGKNSDCDNINVFRK